MPAQEANSQQRDLHEEFILLDSGKRSIERLHGKRNKPLQWQGRSQGRTELMFGVAHHSKGNFVIENDARQTDDNDKNRRPQPQPQVPLIIR